MKKSLSMMMLVMAIMIFVDITILQQYHQVAHAFPCVGHIAKEYCTGYHDGAVQANRNFKTREDLDIDQHRCTGDSTLYCNGYNRGYSDEADFLG